MRVCPSKTNTTQAVSHGTFSSTKLGVGRKFGVLLGAAFIGVVVTIGEISQTKTKMEELEEESHLQHT
jgi:hypothetical protein